MRIDDRFGSISNETRCPLNVRFSLKRTYRHAVLSDALGQSRKPYLCAALHKIQALLTVRSANGPASCCKEVGWHARIAD